MDDRIARLTSPEGCERFARNVETRDPVLARDARRRAVELQAAAHDAMSAVERESLEAIYAYECVLAQKHGRTVRASRTWPMIKRHGIVGTVERAVSRSDDPTGYTALVEMGMQDLAFEAIVAKYPEAFSEKAVARSKDRLTKWNLSHGRTST